MTTDVLERIKRLVQSRDSCVLATSTGDKPHCSLMVYATDDRCREIYMVTHRKGTKYENIKNNPNVSLLIDTREEHRGEDRKSALALTVNGTITEIDEAAGKTSITQKLLSRHPHAAQFLSDPKAAVLAVRVSSFLLLDGLTDSHYIVVDEP